MGVGRLHALDFPERECLHTLLRVSLETVLDVGSRELAPVDWWHVLPLDPPAQLERPSALVGAPLPGLGEVSLEAEIVVAGRLVGERMAPTLSAVSPALVTPIRLRKSRRDT